MQSHTAGTAWTGTALLLLAQPHTQKHAWARITSPGSRRLPPPLRLLAFVASACAHCSSVSRPARSTTRSAFWYLLRACLYRACA